MSPPPAHHRSLPPEMQRYDDIERLVELELITDHHAAVSRLAARLFCR